MRNPISIVKAKVTEGSEQMFMESQMATEHTNVNSKRPHSDGSPSHPMKRQNYEILSPSLKDPFSPSASDVIDTSFQQLIINAIATDSLVQGLLTNMIENAVKERTQEQENKICYLQGMVDSLTVKVNKLEEEAEAQHHLTDHLEQYSRRHSLRIVNEWPEEKNEDTDLKVYRW